MTQPYKVSMLFPSIIHEYDFEEFDANPMIDFCYDVKNKNSVGKINSNRGGWHSEFFNITDDNVISSALAKGLGKSVFTSIEPTLGVDVTYWIMINPSTSYNTSHTHPESHLSGVMWIKTPKDCGDIQFNNPAEFSGFVELNSYKDEVKDKTCTFGSILYTPKAGKMLTFPASLRHEVKVNESSEDRIAVSYNIRISDVSE